MYSSILTAMQYTYVRMYVPEFSRQGLHNILTSPLVLVMLVH